MCQVDTSVNAVCQQWRLVSMCLDSDNNMNPGVNRVCVYVCVCRCVCMYVCMYVCMRVHVCTCASARHSHMEAIRGLSDSCDLIKFTRMLQ